MSRNKNSIVSLKVVVPITILIALIVFVLLYAKGRSVEKQEATIQFLEDPEEYYLFNGENENSKNYIVFDSSDQEFITLANNVCHVMDTMRLDYKLVDIWDASVDFSDIDLLLLCSAEPEFFGSQFDDFVNWLQTGNLIWCCMPNFSDKTDIVSHMIGIIDTDGLTVDGYGDISFKNNLVPGLDSITLSGLDLLDNCLKVTLDEHCVVYASTKDENIPLIWDLNNGVHHISVFNNNLLFERRTIDGLMAHLISKHREVSVWPIMNALLVYIDDFPAPQPEGFDERLKSQFGYDTQSFFMNVWWPKMKSFTEKYGLVYSGVLVETYNDNTTPPFERGVAGSLLRYYGTEILATNGEITLHGYNHQPLSPLGFENEDDYLGWPSTDNMAIAANEFFTYATNLFPELTFTAYVPPSNLLSEEGYEVIKDMFPDLKVVSGLYYDYEGGFSYNTDYVVNEDGIINVPRVTSGFHIESFDNLLLYNTVLETGAVSHFIHPDDVLDDDRGADLGWKIMSESFDESLDHLITTYPMLRPMTASSGGAVVQRMQYLIPSYNLSEDKNTLEINLENYVDESWLALCIDRKVLDTVGGQTYRIKDDFYWVRCDGNKVIIHLEDKEAAK